MKQKLLFPVAFAAMLWAGITTANALNYHFSVMGQELKVNEGTTTIGNIIVDQSVEDRVLRITFDELEGKTLDVPANTGLIEYVGDDFDYVLVGFNEDLEINHSLNLYKELFHFEGLSSALEVWFVNNDPNNDVTLKINITSENLTATPMFEMRNIRLHWNTFDIVDNDKDKLKKLNLDCNTFTGVFYNTSTYSELELGYADYHFASNNADAKTDVFFGTLNIKGLGDISKGEAHNYVSFPQGLYTVNYSESKFCGLYDCTSGSDDRYNGEVTLKYVDLPSGYQHFGPNDDSDWMIMQSCEGLILNVYGSGDLSSVTEMPWEDYKDYVTELNVYSQFMYDDFIALPEGAFKDFSALKRANIAGAYTLESISKHCFENCPELETFEFPSMYSITTIGDSAFNNCTSLGTLYLPDGIEEIGQYAFSYCSVSDITIPATLKIVGRNAFYKCHTLRISQGIGEVTPGPLANRNIFTGENLSLYYEGTLEEWLTGDFSWVMDYATDNKEHLFIDGNEIIDLVIPEGITELNRYAFASCTGLKSVTFPSTLTKIGARAFKSCSGITGIDLPDNITEILIECFAGCGSVTTLKLSKGLTVIRDQAFTNLSITELTIPDGVTKIGSSAFAYNHDLTEVTLPKNLSEISNESFEYTQLKKVIVPSGIGEVAMSGSSTQFSQVTEIRFGGDLDEWLAYSREWLMKNVAKDYLDNNNEMVIRQLDLYLEGSDEPLKSVVIPDGVIEIPACAFHKTSITDLSFSEEVTSIGAGAFAGCYNLATAETKARIPAALGEDAFNDIDENAVLRVYSSAVADYEATDWGKYFKIEGAFAEFKVTAAASDEALGEVTLTFGDEDVLSKGEEKNSFMVVKDAKGHLTATPKDKYTEFVMWNDDAEGFDQAERDVTITGDFDYIAKFKKDSFDVKVVAEGIDPASVEIIGAGKYGRGDKVTLTFKLKDENYTFEEWRFDNNNFESGETLVFDEIDANHDVQIVFNAKYYSVTAKVTPEGAGVVKGQGDYEYYTEYTLTLEPAEGWELKEWRDGVVLEYEKSNTLTGLVYGEINIEVVLQKIHYTISAAVNDEKMGSVTGAGSYEHGSAATLTATAKSGYKFKQWSDGNTDNPRTVTVTEDKTYTAEFELATVYYTVTFLDYDGTELLKEQVEEGKDAKGPATDPSREGYTFTGWAPAITNITADLTVIAQYDEIVVIDYKPQNLKAEVITLEDKDQRITLSWDAVEGVPSYELRLFYNGLSLYQSNTFGKREVSILLSELQNEVPELAPGTYQIDWQVRSTDALTQPMSEWVAGKQFEVIVPMPTGLENVGTQPSADGLTADKARKVLRNGRVIIITPDGREYNAAGVKVI